MQGLSDSGRGFRGNKGKAAEDALGSEGLIQDLCHPEGHFTGFLAEGYREKHGLWAVRDWGLWTYIDCRAKALECMWMRRDRTGGKPRDAEYQARQGECRIRRTEQEAPLLPSCRPGLLSTGRVCSQMRLSFSLSW